MTARLSGATLALLVAVVTGCSTDEPASAPGTPETAVGRGGPAPTTPPTTGDAEALEEELGELAALERRRGGRVGVFALDTGSGRSVSYRADERFAMASTVKVLTAATVLDQLSDRDLGRRVRWAEDDLVEHSPVTGLHVEDGLTVRELVDASLTVSDNTAANLLLDRAGGPGAVEGLLAVVGDDVTSVDRREPDLNDWEPGETRDTSTPRALGSTLDALLLGELLAEADRTVLEEALADSVTGAGLVRAGVPDGFVVGDKSGTAAHGTRNDLAIVRPPGRAPWVVAVMTSHHSPDAEPDDGLVAAATRAVVEALRA